MSVIIVEYLKTYLLNILIFFDNFELHTNKDLQTKSWKLSQILSVSSFGSILDMSLCPVKTWKLYTSKLSPKLNSLWQRPKQGYIHYVDEEWYDPRPVGKDMLERFMKLSLAKSVQLDGEYTNHSIRATVINTLDTAGFEARHIIKLTSHKNESTVKEYATKCPENKRKEMFQSLSDAMLPKSKK